MGLGSGDGPLGKVLLLQAWGPKFVSPELQQLGIVTPVLGMRKMQGRQLGPLRPLG